MTKKHFIALADAVAHIGLTDKQMDTLADFCHSQNRQFNRFRWMGYVKGECGPSGGPVKPAKSLVTGGSR